MKATVLLLGTAFSTALGQTLITSAATISACKAHSNHWDCPSGISEPTALPPSTLSSETHDHDHDHNTSITKTACEPHGDHWHCPPGIPKPTTPPAAVPVTESRDHDHDVSVTATTCVGHGDHWHCPSGIAVPTTLPPVTLSVPSTTTQTTNAAVTGARNDKVAAVFFGGLGVFLL